MMFNSEGRGGCAPKTSLSRRTKLMYGLGDWGSSASTTARNAFWFFFLTNVVGLGAATAGSVFLVGRLWDGVNDPLVGMLSDRTQSRWGRRRPFLIFGAIPFSLTFFLLFFVPPIASPPWLAVYYAIAFLLFDTFYTVVNAPYVALMAELTDDYDERGDLAGWRMSISILAALVTAGTFKLLAEQGIGAWLGGDVTAIRAGYALVAALWGLSFMAPLLLLARNIREPLAPVDDDPFRPWRSLREVFANRPFRLAAIIYMLSFATADVVLLVFARFLLDYVRVTPGYDSLLMALVMGMALVSMPLIVRMMRQFGKRETYIVNMVIMALVMFLVSQTPPGGWQWITVAAVAAGPGFAAANVLPWAIAVDVIEADEVRSGKRREGLYAGYLVFFRKLASGVAIFFAGHALAWAGLVSTTTGTTTIAQPAATLAMLRFMVGGLPLIMLTVAIIAAWRYPLDRATHARLRARARQARPIATTRL